VPSIWKFSITHHLSLVTRYSVLSFLNEEILSAWHQSGTDGSGGVFDLSGRAGLGACRACHDSRAPAFHAGRTGLRLFAYAAARGSVGDLADPRQAGHFPEEPLFAHAHQIHRQHYS